MPVRMRYAETVGITSSAGLNGTYVIAANGLFDPNISGVGHQPRTFDQLMLFYDHYVVVGVKLRCLYTHKENAPVMIGYTIRDSATVEADNNNTREYPSTRYLMSSQADAGGSTKTMTLKLNPNKWLGRSKPLSDPHLKGTSSANPSEGAFIHIWFYRPDGTAITTGQISYQLDYSAVLIEPKIGNPS